MANAFTYVRNVGRSVGYASFEVLKQKNPVFHDFAETNGELATDMYRSMKDLKKNIKELPNKIMESQYGQFAKTYKDNLFEDLKSGKFYNKERKEQYETDAGSAMMEGLDMSVFDDFGDGSDDGFNVSDLENFETSSGTSSNEMMDIVGKKTSEAISTAMGRTAEYIVQANTETAKAQYKQMNAIYGGIHAGMSTINQNISKLLEFSNENMNLHFENSKNFYANINRLDEERNQYLKEISETLKQMNEPAKGGTSSSNKRRYSDLVSSEGNLDISAYKEYLKKNIKDNSGGVFDLLQMASEFGGLRMLAASPLEFLAEGIVNSVIPKALEKSMASLNKSLSGMTGNLLATLKEKANDSEMWGLISDIFGINTDLKTGIDTSRYEKGRVPFDGVTRKAIIEVIPTYLSKILSAINGQERDTFDYEKGKFVTLSDLRKYSDDMERSSANTAASELDSRLREKTRGLSFRNKAEEDQFWKDWEQIKLTMFKEQMRFNTRDKNLSTGTFNLQGGLASEVNLELIKRLLDNESVNMNYANRMFRERSEHNRRMEQMEESSTLNALHNDSTKSDEKEASTDISAILGKANNAIVNKLNDIHKEIAFIRIYGVGYAPSRVRKGKIRGVRPSLENFVIPTSESAIKSKVESSTSTSDNDKEYGSLIDIDDDPKREVDQILSGVFKKNEIKPLTDTEVNKEENKSDNKKKRKTLSQRISDLRKGALGIVQGPLNLASSVIDRVDARLYELVYGPVGGRRDKEDDDRTLSEILFDNLQNQFDKFADWMEEKIFDPLKYKSLKENAHDAAKKFLGIFGIDLDKTVEGIKKFLFGEDEDGNRTKGGFLGKFINDFKDTFKSAKDWIKNGFKEAGDELEITSVKNEKGKAKEERNSGLDELAKTLRRKDGDKRSEAERTEDAITAVKNLFGKNVAEIDQAAEGMKQVKKTGLAVISEGETVIPPDADPYNIAKRYRDERMVKENLKDGIDDIFEFAEGNDPNKKLSKEEYRRINEQKLLTSAKKKILDKDSNISSSFINKLLSEHPDLLRKLMDDKEVSNKIANFVEGKKETTKRDDYVEGREPILYKIGDEALKATEVIKDGVVDALGISKKDTDKFKEKAWKVIGDIKDHGGVLAAGATMGAGVSLLTGLIGGPLVGAAVGAGTALITKSKTVQNMLFGDEESGKPGLLPKKITEGIKKYVPDVAKGGALGAITAMMPFVPGGPLAGILVGSALGFAKNNQQIQDAIFGEDGIGISKEDFQKKVKSILPKMGAGALAGLVAGPFGLTTNILLGSALGFATDTKSFKDVFFGYEDPETHKRSGGIFDAITKPAVEFFKKTFDEFKDFFFKDMLKPVVDAFQPIKKQFELMGNFVKDLFKEHIINPIKNVIRDKILKPMGWLFGKLFTPVKSLAKFVLSAPSKLIGGVGNRLRMHQIKSGNADYMKDANARLAFRDATGKKYSGPGRDNYYDFDESLVNMNADQLSEAQRVFSTINDSKKSIKDIRSSAIKNINDSIKAGDIHADDAGIIQKYLNSNRYDKAIEYISKSNIKDDAKKNILDTVKTESERLANIKDMKKGGAEAYTNALKMLKENYGLNISDDMIDKFSKDDKEASKALKLIQNQMEVMNEKGGDEAATKITDQAEDHHKEIKSKLDEIINNIKDLSNEDSDKYKGKRKKRKKHYDAVASKTEENPLGTEGEYNSEFNSDAFDFIESAYEDTNPVFGTIKLGHRLRKEITDPLFKKAKGAAKVGGKIVSGTYGAAKKGYNFLRDTDSVSSILGDRSVDWHDPETYKNHESKDEKDGIGSYIKRMTGILVAMAAKNGVDSVAISRINNDTDPNTLINKVMDKYNTSTVSQIVDGHVVTYRRDKNGQLNMDTSNAENKEYIKYKDETDNTQKSIAAGLVAMPTTLGSIFGNLFGKDKDKDKKSFLEKIFDFFTGAGEKIGNIKTTLSGVISSVFKGSIPLIVAAFAASGLFDKAASRLSGGAFGSKNSNKAITATDENGNPVQIKTDKEGNPITDENGNYISVNGETISGDAKVRTTGASSTMTLSERLKYNLGRGMVTGKGSILGNIVKKTANKIGKKTGISTLVKAATDSATINSVINKLMDNVDNYIKALKKVPFLKKFVNDDMIIDLGVGLGNLIEKSLPKAGSAVKSLGKSLSKFALPIAIATAIADFTTGWQDASTILKIKTEHVTTPQKIICGLVKSLKNLIPIVGTFIPEQIITDFFINHVSKWFKIDTSKIKSQRDEAQAELDDYNAENGTNYTWADYNKKVLGNYTWTEKIGNSVKSLFIKKKSSSKSTNTAASGSSININYGKGSNIYGRGSGVANTFISQLDPKYKNKQFNIAGDSQVQTLGDSGCAPAAAAMAVNSTLGSQAATMDSASNLALKYKVKDDGVNASYFGDEFARHGIYANYITTSDNGARNNEIYNQLMNNNKVVLMGQDIGNKSKANSPFGPNPHYVLANGISKDGKYIYINDPESNKPNIKYSTNKVIGSSKMGIAATVARGTNIFDKFTKYIGRGSVYSSDTIQYKVWNALRAAGYNEIAVAAAMGNIQHESAFNPAAIEKSNGVGFGLIQWSHGRRTAIENYAKQKGVSASSLELQIEYLLLELQANSGIWTKGSTKYGFGSLTRNDWADGKDLVKATQAFMCCFERPSYDSNINHIDRRIESAKEYYQAFTGKAIDTNLKYNTTPYSANTSSTTTSTSNTSTSGSLLSSITSFISKLTNAYGLTKEETSTNESGDASTAYTGTVIGNTVSNTEKAQLQKALVEKMYSIQGKLKYAQNNAKYPGSRNPEDGSGDCSSTVQWAYQKILGIDPGSWTGAQRNNPNTYTVATSTKDESVLQLGDLLLKDGHVEMYAGNNTMIGHGGGKNGQTPGPTVKNLDKSGKYDLVRRWIGFKGMGSGLFGRGSDDHPTDSPFDVALRYVKPDEYGTSLPFGLDNENLDQSSTPQTNKLSQTKPINKIAPKPAQKQVITGRASYVESSTQESHVNNSDSLIEILKSMLTKLTELVGNTNSIDKIFSLLADYFVAVKTNSTENTEETKNTAVLAKQSLINALQSSSSSNEPNAQLMRLIEVTEKIARE